MLEIKLFVFLICFSLTSIFLVVVYGHLFNMLPKRLSVKYDRVYSALILLQVFAGALLWWMLLW